MRALVNLTHDDAVKSEWSWLSVSVVSSLLTTITSSSDGPSSRGADVMRIWATWLIVWWQRWVVTVEFDGNFVSCTVACGSGHGALWGDQRGWSGSGVRCGATCSGGAMVVLAWAKTSCAVGAELVRFGAISSDGAEVVRCWVTSSGGAEVVRFAATSSDGALVVRSGATGSDEA